MIVRDGSLVDAKLIEAAGNPVSYEKATLSDPNASWGGKGDEPTFGYRGHIGLDGESELIRRAELTSANVLDSQLLEAMLSGDKQAVYADKDYDCQRDRCGCIKEA